MAITDADGDVVNINSYDSYGIPGSANAGRFQYTGQAWLPELGLYYYKARMYSPTLGRFLQTDPIGYGDGMNWYDYFGGLSLNIANRTGVSLPFHIIFRFLPKLSLLGSRSSFPFIKWYVRRDQKHPTFGLLLLINAGICAKPGKVPARGNIALCGLMLQ